MKARSEENGRSAKETTASAGGSTTSSSATPSSLDATYRWFQDEILRRNAAAGLLREDATEANPPGPERVRVEDVLTPSRTLTSEERLEIYAEGYFLRLRDVLASDFVAVRKTLGNERFTELARAYLTRYPSNHYSLNFLGSRFAGYLARFGEQDGFPDSELLADLARIERAMACLVDAEETASLPPEAFARLPAEEWSTSRLRPIAALHLFAVSHRVNRRITEARGEATLPPAPREATWIAVYRVEYRVIRLDLSRFEHDLLVALQDGATILEAIERAAASWDRDEDELGHVVYASFNRLAAEGLFSAIE